jgi:hypothetical protein
MVALIRSVRRFLVLKGTATALFWRKDKFIENLNYDRAGIAQSV